MSRADVKDESSSDTKTLHRAIYEQLAREITGGGYRPGDRLPSESVLCERFGASRITVAKALGAMQHEGLVTRRAGSGTFVQGPVAGEGYQFGLLIPQLGSTEIFEPICGGIMRSPLAKPHVLIWGPTCSEDEAEDLGRLAEQLCRQLVDRKVSGVFFAPVEYAADKDAANYRIVQMLKEAKIPVVLLDRCLEPYPQESLDLAGIDNGRAGYLLTRHLWNAGARRIAFVARKRSASTILERIGGFQFALSEVQPGTAARVLLGDVTDPAFLRNLLEGDRPDALVCGNDLTAARLMRALLDEGIRIPENIRLAGFDDVRYAKFLPVPLTTVHQNCSEIGRAALSLMLARLREPKRAPWEVRVPFHLVVRQSCGAKMD